MLGARVYVVALRCRISAPGWCRSNHAEQALTIVFGRIEHQLLNGDTHGRANLGIRI